MTFNRPRRPYGGSHTRAARLAVLATVLMSLAAVAMKALPA